MVSYCFVSSLLAQVQFYLQTPLESKRKILPCAQEPMQGWGYFISFTLSLHSYRPKRILQAHPNTHTHIPVQNAPGGFCSPGKQTSSKSPSLNFIPSLVPPSRLWWTTDFWMLFFMVIFFSSLYAVAFFPFPQLARNRSEENNSSKAPNNEGLI